MDIWSRENSHFFINFLFLLSFQLLREIWLFASANVDSVLSFDDLEKFLFDFWLNKLNGGNEFETFAVAFPPNIYLGDNVSQKKRDIFWKRDTKVVELSLLKSKNFKPQKHWAFGKALEQFSKSERKSLSHRPK